MSVNRAAPSDVSRIAVLGSSLKMEVVELEPDAGDTIDDADEFDSRLATPQFGFLFTAQAAGGALTMSLAFGTDATNGKTVQINLDDGTIAADENLVAVIFGT
jgi:hypothetical protein